MARLRTTFLVGRLLRRSVVDFLRKTIFGLDLDMRLEKIGGGWFETEYGLEVVGPDEKIMRFKERMDKYFEILT